ncbi:ribokinase [Hoyosella sp. G463]|uniref:Ribokinase n=1 Tax=Lolliginicoccus lacisalsi TaxID=2742202 RepID=A0A927JAF3_9ACTN|nr:ribokinase [Lolliginicoccus lacisalsi]MBD8505661.1 ribokinase [Lolliginicoccus lacisalsi]
MSRIAVLGSVNMDLVTRAPRIPAVGETVLGESLAEIPGGKGANQAKAAARLGGEVWFLGALGADRFAGTLRESLEQAGVHLPEARAVDAASGLAAISVDHAGDNAIIVVPGANAAMTALLPEERRRIVECDVLLMQCELPISIVTEAAMAASAAGATVMLNPSPARELPSDLASSTDVLIVNEHEAAVLHADLRHVRHVVTTRGGAGASYRGPGGGEIETAPPAVDVVDTTGAGDAFAGALAAFWHTGPRTALRWATAAGAVATTRPGAFAPPLTLVAEYVEHDEV